MGGILGEGGGARAQHVWCRKEYPDTLTDNAPPPSSLLSPGGLLALASCSSHVPAPMFNELCEEAVLGGARRQATVLAMQVCGEGGSAWRGAQAGDSAGYAGV